MTNSSFSFKPNKYVFAGICATTMALGFIRFDLGLLASMMAQSNWIVSSDIGNLAAFGMLAAIGGCFTQANIRNQKQSIKLIQWLVLIIPITFFLEAFKPNLQILRLIQFGSGWISGAITTAIPSIVLSFIKDEQKSTASTQIWMGGGLGAIIGALIIDTLGRGQSPRPVLNFIGVLCVFMCIPVISLLRSYQANLQNKNPSYPLSSNHNKDQPEIHSNPKRNRQKITVALVALSAGFILMNISQVPFLAMQQSIISNKLHISTSSSSVAYMLLGVGSLLGSVIPSILIHRGAHIKILLQFFALLGLTSGILFSLSNSLIIFSIAAILYGFWEMCTASLTAGRIFELVPDSDHTKIWGMTGVFGQSSFAIFGFTSQSSASSNISSILNIGLIALTLHATCEFIQSHSKINE